MDDSINSIDFSTYYNDISDKSVQYKNNLNINNVVIDKDIIDNNTFVDFNTTPNNNINTNIENKQIDTIPNTIINI